MSGYDPFGKENSRFVRKESACQVSRAFYLYLTRYIHDTVSDSQCRRQYDLIRQILHYRQGELSGYDLFVPTICGFEQNRLWQKGRYQ